MPTPTYTPLANITLGSSAASVTFSSISQAYRDLVLVSNILGATADANLFLRFNGDTGTNYSFVQMYGSGSSTGTSAATLTQVVSGITASTTQRATATHSLIDYSATDKHKSLLNRSDSAQYVGTFAIATRWANTAAITSIQAFTSSDAFAAGSTFALYGIAA